MNMSRWPVILAVLLCTALSETDARPGLKLVRRIAKAFRKTPGQGADSPVQSNNGLESSSPGSSKTFGVTADGTRTVDPNAPLETSVRTSQAPLGDTDPDMNYVQVEFGSKGNPKYPPESGPIESPYSQVNVEPRPDSSAGNPMEGTNGQGPPPLPPRSSSLNSNPKSTSALQNDPETSVRTSQAPLDKTNRDMNYVQVEFGSKGNPEYPPESGPIESPYSQVKFDGVPPGRAAPGSEERSALVQGNGRSAEPRPDPRTGYEMEGPPPVAPRSKISKKDWPTSAGPGSDSSMENPMEGTNGQGPQPMEPGSDISKQDWQTSAGPGSGSSTGNEMEGPRPRAQQSAIPEHGQTSSTSDASEIAQIAQSITSPQQGGTSDGQVRSTEEDLRSSSPPNEDVLDNVDMSMFEPPE